MNEKPLLEFLFLGDPTAGLTCGRAFDGICLGTCENAILPVHTLGRRRSPARQVQPVLDCPYFLMLNYSNNNLLMFFKAHCESLNITNYAKIIYYK